MDEQERMKQINDLASELSLLIAKQLTIAEESVELMNKRMTLIFEIDSLASSEYPQLREYADEMLKAVGTSSIKTTPPQHKSGVLA